MVLQKNFLSKIRSIVHMVTIKINYYSRGWAHQDTVVQWFVIVYDVLHPNFLFADTTFCDWIWQSVIAESNSRMNGSLRRTLCRATKYLFGNYITAYGALPIFHVCDSNEKAESTSSDLWMRTSSQTYTQAWRLNAASVTQQTFIKNPLTWIHAVDSANLNNGSVTCPCKARTQKPRNAQSFHGFPVESHLSELPALWTAKIFGTLMPFSNPGHQWREKPKGICMTLAVGFSAYHHLIAAILALRKAFLLAHRTNAKLVTFSLLYQGTT